MQLFAIFQCTVYTDVNVVLWKSTFYILFNMSSFFPVYFSVYMPMSASLYHCHLSLHHFGSHWKCISTCVGFFWFFIWLILLSQASEFPLLLPYILASSFNSFFSFNLEKDTLFYIWQAVWTQPNQKPLAFQIASLVKEDKSPPSISFLEILWEGMSGMATAMLMAVIVDTSYLSGTLYPSLHLSPRYSIWRVCIVTFHHFT